MSAKILDGKKVRDKIAKGLIKEIKKLEPKPKLVIIQIGDLSESNTYIKQKILFAEKIGAVVQLKKLDEKFSQVDLEVLVANLNSDKSVHGIIVQMPIPKELDKDAIIDKISPVKDVDGLTATNLKLLFENKKGGYTPATTRGIISLLNFYQIPVHGRNVTVVGRSTLVGKPTTMTLMNLDATVTVCHSRTKKLPDKTKNADILIVAAGKPGLIKEYFVNEKQVVIDVGINVADEDNIEEGGPRKLVGDVDYQEVSPIVSAITPVPGGIGPMTVVSLYQNLLEAYRNQT